MAKRDKVVTEFMDTLKARTPHEDVFHEAVEEVVTDLIPFINANKIYKNAALLERMTEPERVVSFRVVWERDDGDIQVNRAYRVQFNGAIGPYKGGLRFHPTVTPSVLKFLGFEQTFKNALTGLPMGGGKGGSDFNPKGCSEREIARFCTAFMRQLYRHIGANVDIPAGDINVGAREIGYLFGAYRAITGKFEGVLTGKGLSFGGSEMRVAATGYGVIYFLQHMLSAHDQELKDKTVVVSGAGNVALHAAELAVQVGAKVVSLSDSGGFIYDKDGLTQDKIDWTRDHKAKSGSSLETYADKFGAKWTKNKTPWTVKCDIALPCATQNEMDEEGAKALIKNGCSVIVEGANMPLTAKAQSVVKEAGILFGPAKAANAGGVAVSGLEITQDRMRKFDSADQVKEDLQVIMKKIHERCAEHGKDKSGKINYAKGANIAGFIKVADAMMAQGLV